MVLGPEERKLLAEMVAVHRRLLPRTEPFGLLTYRYEGANDEENYLAHRGLPERSLTIDPADLDALIENGLVEPLHSDDPEWTEYVLTNKGLMYLR